VDSFHTGNVGAAQFSGRFQLAAHAQVFFAHGEKFAAQRIIDHAEIIFSVNARLMACCREFIASIVEEQPQILRLR
jgi:hypothetical protein